MFEWTVTLDDIVLHSFIVQWVRGFRSGSRQLVSSHSAKTLTRVAGVNAYVCLLSDERCDLNLYMMFLYCCPASTCCEPEHHEQHLDNRWLVDIILHFILSSYDIVLYCIISCIWVIPNQQWLYHKTVEWFDWFTLKEIYIWVRCNTWTPCCDWVWVKTS